MNEVNPKPPFAGCCIFKFFTTSIEGFQVQEKLNNLQTEGSDRIPATFCMKEESALRHLSQLISL